MIIFSLFPLLAALLSLSIGNYVLYRGPKNHLTAIFYFVTVCVFLWGGFEFGFHQAASYTNAKKWLDFFSFWPLSISIGMHFVLVFTGKNKEFNSNFIYLLVYFPAIIFLAYFLILAPESKVPVKATWGWTYDLPKNDAVYLLSYIWTIIISIFSIILCFRYYLKATTPLQKSHAMYVFWCVTLTLLAGIITAIIFPYLNIHMPQLTTVGFLIAYMISSIAIWKKDLFILTPMSAASDIISTMPDSLLLVNAENQITFANTSALKILGYSENEIVSLPVNMVFKESSSIIESIVKKGLINDTKTVLITKDQCEISVSLAASMVGRQSNAHSGIVFIARDIRDSLQSITRLKESEDKYRGIAERSFDLIFMVDNIGNLTYVSPSLNCLFLYHPEDVLGQPFKKFVVSSDVGKMMAVFDQFNRGEEIGTQQIKLLKKDGSITVAEFNLSRIYIDDKHIGTQGIVRDISDRKKYEAELKENEQKYKLIFENVNDAIVFLDSSGNVLEVNHKIKEIFGLGRDEIIGKDFREFQHLLGPEDFKKVIKIFEDVIFRGISPTEVVNISNLSGLLLTVEVNARMVLKDSSIIGLILIIKDITKRIKAEKENKILGRQLFRAQKMEALGTMASGVAHDFNNSLSTIILNAEAALEEAPVKGELRHYLDQVLKTSTRSKKLVHQILTFSRDKEVARRPMNISVIVKETFDMLKPMLPSSIEIQGRIDPYTWPVLADATQIQQLIVNLCSNGSHAMKDKGGKLLLLLENKDIDKSSSDTMQETSLRPGKYVMLMVKDTGHGIVPEIRDRIFDPFFTTKEQGEGTGLGLSVVHGIVASHEGVILLNTEPGKGATFFIYFPVVENEVVKATSKNGPMPSGKESILFVDDESDFVDISKRMLSRLGYQVQGVTNAMGAIELFKSKHRQFDIVITDLTMPYMTGIELAKELMRIQPDIPVIVCTGLSSSIDHEEIKEAGIKGYIMKPFVVREMAETVRQVLDGHFKICPDIT